MDLARPLVDHAFLSFCLSVSRYICIDWDSMASGVRGRFDEAQKAQRRFFIVFYMKDLLAWRGGVVQLYFPILCYIFIKSWSLTS
ncbi:uncharacterized protein ASPGLDRAFT_406451 [Aspergillus glaucus CBS 516.65]|uniref:Uncharacterized protein n=1 Tax=Aspergillus glaucus CBS 516.65 TaxID=1160497 RepID=A0A1L9VHT4_ASPGL|nr:hypothetical protein ASPGLDRAFT_406451 [Aspergillus glaucus CBS 516.65]OJJ83491.1 hypothetical protein ASPGLDRAFT_406451 [Aspergillus glaucus CBS 516.65]